MSTSPMRSAPSSDTRMLPRARSSDLTPVEAAKVCLEARADGVAVSLAFLRSINPLPWHPVETPGIDCACRLFSNCISEPNLSDVAQFVRFLVGTDAARLDDHPQYDRKR